MLPVHLMPRSSAAGRFIYIIRALPIKALWIQIKCHAIAMSFQAGVNNHG
jgi:hypothetical protein